MTSDIRQLCLALISTEEEISKKKHKFQQSNNILDTQRISLWGTLVNIFRFQGKHGNNSLTFSNLLFDRMTFTNAIIQQLQRNSIAIGQRYDFTLNDGTLIKVWSPDYISVYYHTSQPLAIAN